MTEAARAILIGGGGADGRAPQWLDLARANRHGLIAGATGTGKTVTLQALAEGFSAAGVPVLAPDVKGDLSGLIEPAPESERLAARARAIGLEPYRREGFPVVFWDVFGAAGHPVRATVSDIGPLLMARLLELNEAQEGVLNIVFRLADEEGLLLLDLRDLRALVAEVGARAAALSRRYGHVAAASVGAIQRRLLVLETQGADRFLGEPALALSDLIARAPDGRGRINLLAADRLMQAPRLYATLMLWLLSELFEALPEVGDPEKPVFVLFFDEAHLLFDGAPKPLLETVERVARLIRSKGVGVYFVTQNPADLPDAVLGQLGARVLHALRAYTPRQRRALAAAAETFRPNPAFDAATALGELGVGEALVSTLGARGVPSMVERTLIRPPASRIGPADPGLRAAAFAASPVAGRYDRPVDRESAHEMLAARAARAAPEEAEGETFRAGRRYRPDAERGRGDGLGEAFAKSLARSLGTQLGRRLGRGALGGLLRGR